MFYRDIAFPLLSRLDAEWIHEVALRFLATPVAQNILRRWNAHVNAKPVHILGLDFPTPVGLAAGFDKNAVAILALQELFGFLEIGTITPEPQEGNPRPRMWRLLEDRGLINALGFNGEGARRVRDRLERTFRLRKGPLGGSLGKMKSTPNEEAAQDYVFVLRFIRAFVDYLVVNISSPNTPGLRELQTRRYIENLLRTVTNAETQAARAMGEKPHPTLVKISPDLLESEIMDVLEACFHANVAGLIVGNTTLSREGLLSPLKGNQGGVSGAPLTERIRRLAAFIRKHAPTFPLIGVGGIMEPEDASVLFDLGVNLVQLLTGFFYGGPAFPQQVTQHVQGHY